MLFFNSQCFLAYNIYLLKMKTVTIALVILSLASVSTCLNWEYAGNWSASNTTAIDAAIIRSMIASPQPADATKYNLGTFAKKLSEDLETNLNWAQFWNVFVVIQEAASDTVVYGYAFNNHWLWKNNVQFSGLSTAFVTPAGKNIGLIIWKDYNCQKRVYSTAPITDCTFKDTVKAAIQTAILADTKPRLQSEIWTTAMNIVEAVENYQTQTLIGGNNRAYSAVLSQDKAAVFYGAYCQAQDAGGVQGGHSFTSGLDFGTLFLFQTRDYPNAVTPGA